MTAEGGAVEQPAEQPIPPAAPSKRPFDVIDAVQSHIGKFSLPSAQKTLRRIQTSWCPKTYPRTNQSGDASNRSGQSTCLPRQCNRAAKAREMCEEIAPKRSAQEDASEPGY